MASFFKRMMYYWIPLHGVLWPPE